MKPLSKRVLFLVASITVPPMAEAAESPEQFVRHVYAGYGSGAEPVSLRDDGAVRILTPSLNALLQKNREVLNGRRGLLEIDPLCQCETHALALDDVQARMTGGDRAKVTASFENAGMSHRVRLDLRRAGQSWRIDDIWSDDQLSLRVRIAGEIASLIPQR